MSGTEIAFTFTCGDEALIGILHQAILQGGRPQPEVGVLVVVGGPQYRVGSHRQFELLARHLAANGYPVLRFDYRGMGDSPGDQRTFEDVDEDIRCAIDALIAQCPTVRRVVIFGLCDAASAALMYGPGDARVAGLALLNPWARSDQSLAKTQLRHYYVQRLFQRELWAKLLGGDFSVRKSFTDLAQNVRRALSKSAPASPTYAKGSATRARAPFLARMLAGWRALKRPVLLMISERDLTAAEFLAVVGSSSQWQRAMRAMKPTRHSVADADHTCSRRIWRDEVEDTTLTCILSLERALSVPNT
jgi:exosortase A-associated hydrolase 1